FFGPSVTAGIRHSSWDQARCGRARRLSQAQAESFSLEVRARGRSVERLGDVLDGSTTGVDVDGPGRVIRDSAGGRDDLVAVVEELGDVVPLVSGVAGAEAEDRVGGFAEELVDVVVVGWSVVEPGFVGVGDAAPRGQPRCV